MNETIINGIIEESQEVTGRLQYAAGDVIKNTNIVNGSKTGSLRTVDGQTLLFPYYDGQLIKDVINQAISSLVSGDLGNQNRVYVLVIQNGTTEQGLARNTSFLLQSAGYEVLETKNADRNDYEKTEIINHIGNSEAAKTLGNFIHCTNIIDEEVMPENADSTSAAQADFTIILGSDFDGRYVH